eukprot:79514-Rhodomonas_salina.1
MPSLASTPQVSFRKPRLQSVALHERLQRVSLHQKQEKQETLCMQQRRWNVDRDRVASQRAG